MKNKILILVFMSFVLVSLCTKAQNPEVIFDTVNYNNGIESMTFRYARFRAIIVDSGSWKLTGIGIAVSTNSGFTPYLVRLAGTPTLPTRLTLPYNFSGQTGADALAPSTTYYAKAFVRKSTAPVDTAWSNVITFTTPAAIPPTMNVQEATGIGLDNATINISIDFVNDPVRTWTKKGFIYSLNPNPLHGAGTIEEVISGSNPNNNNSNTPMLMNKNISGLISGATYYVRAFIIVQFGAGDRDTIYSTQKPFTTRHACGTAPANLDATEDVGQTTALIKWVKQLGQDRWLIDCGIVGHTPGEGVFLQMVTDDTFVVATGLTPGIDYTAYAKAVCGDTAFSEWSALNPSAYFRTLPYVCAPLADIKAVQVLNSSAVIHWTPGAVTQWRWEVMIATYYDSYPQTGIMVKFNPEFSPVGLSPSTMYKVKVRAICNKHDDILDSVGDWSEITFTTKSEPDIGLDSVFQTPKSSVKIYPNPTSNVINFDYGEEKIKKIEIIDELGKIIATINRNVASYRFEKGRTGTFLIRIYSDKGVQNEKIIVE